MVPSTDCMIHSTEVLTPMGMRAITRSSEHRRRCVMESGSSRNHQVETAVQDVNELWETTVSPPFTPNDEAVADENVDSK